MSQQSNQIVSIWKDIEHLTRCNKYTYDHIELPSNQCLLVADAYLLWYLCTYDTLLSGGFSPNALDVRWIHLVCSLDIHDIAVFLKDADSLLLRNESTSYSDFKHHLSEHYPFCGSLLAPLKQIIVGWFDDQSIPHFSLFHSWLNFIGRVNITSPSHEAAALEDYLAIERDLQVDGFTTAETQLITSWFPRSQGYDFATSVACRHSGGSTADAGRHLVDKYLSYSKDVRLRYLGTDNDPPRCSSSGFQRMCKLVFVPKSLTSYRSISMEPASLMWHQQGILNAWVSLLRRHRTLSKRFNPADQQSNRDLAWEGSVDGNLVTIDLSSASDSVSWPMIKLWFRDTYLYKWMLCTRSTSVLLPDSTNMPLKKFAPMGSALCFPTESVVFSAIVECAIRECGGNPVSSRYRVYGDDIIVERNYSDAVIARLTANGFTVNRKKTFVSSSPSFTFRESCGGEYLNGVDVTPLRLSRRFSGLFRGGSRRNPSQIEALIELANDCYNQYPSVRRRILHSLALLPPKYRPLFDSTGQQGIFSVVPTNWHLPSPVWSDPYQAFYLFHGRSTIKRSTDDMDAVEDIRLFEYLRQCDGRQRLLYPEDKVIVDLHRQIAGTWTVTSSPAEGIYPRREDA